MIPLFCGQMIPFHCLPIVLSYTFVLAIHQIKIGMRIHIS